jgi:uncharacterized membrane protein YdbT with pleckstrin-like domain
MEATMEDRTIRPSMKTVWAAYLLSAAVVAAGIWAYLQFAQDQPQWLAAIPLIVFLAPLRMHLKRRLITLRLHDDHLTIETGFFSRTRRTVDVAKIQDVTVRQTFGQRLLGTGDLMLESAGEAGAMAIQNLDRPRRLADAIIAASKQSPLVRPESDPRSR